MVNKFYFSKNNYSYSLGLFLVRESSTFIGDFTLSFLHNGSVHHCRIKTSITAGGDRKYHLLDTIRRDTLYELISYYTRHSLDTPNFKVQFFFILFKLNEI
jgi:phosphatidylinositol phospholipase C, gamma-1